MAVLGIEQCPLYALLTKKQVHPGPASLFANPLCYEYKDPDTK